jgi:hypothetical protein
VLTNLFTNVLLAVGSVSGQAPAEAVNATPAVADRASDVSADAPASWTVGPFATYSAAADYADYLEIELGYYTRVFRAGNGYYYVSYW